MNSLNEFLAEIGHEELPRMVVDRNGLRVFTDSDCWRLNTAGQDKDAINVGRLKDHVLRYAFSRYMIYRIERHSPATAISAAYCILSQLEKVGFLRKHYESDDRELALIDAVSNVLSGLRSNNRVSEFYDLARWYIWGADHTLECGFNYEFALQLSRIKIPGGVKGEAVRSKDSEVGPLHFELEEPLVRRALLEDESESFEHRQQRLAVALCLAFGRNPLNYVRLREEDFINLTADFSEAPPLWQLNIPRIKKRASPRELFRAETCDPKLAAMIQDLINYNKQHSTCLNGRELPRSLFLRQSPIPRLVGTDSEDYAFCKTTSDFQMLISSWARRMKLTSPVTGCQLRLTSRRLRYTFACNMARQGASRAALAEMLDHTDTQHVGVYYELFDEMVAMLDKALALKMGKVIGWFKGKIVDGNEQAINGDNPDKYLFFVGEENPQEQIEIGVCGKRRLCHLDPPYTCYLCPKFQPYRHADHERVLRILLEDRQARLNKYDNNRLGIQLDDVILAVGQAVMACREL
ncbi:MAG TPA: tyrosine-type recombinase/integrase [Gallionellaceae bacterium]|nr:tyrosine-type recombinase/integrase [Gallionellaceae bacterium]